MLKDFLLKNTKKLEIILQKKNKDYGDSFYKSLDKNGIKALTIRLEDKFNRLEYLADGNKNEIKDESINDTILDIAGYCMLYLTYIDEKEGK